MPRVSIIQNAFNAGILGPMMEGRTDHEKHPFGCKEMKNFFPVIQGPAIKRSGFRHVHMARHDDKECRLVRFEFGVAQAYILEFGEGYIRFYRGTSTIDSGVVLAFQDTNLAIQKTIISIAKEDTPLVTINFPIVNTHIPNDVYFAGLTGMTELNGRYFRINKIDTLTFRLVGVDTTNYSTHVNDGTTANSIDYPYEITATTATNSTASITIPFQEEDLDDLVFTQSADVLYIAHPNYRPYKLERYLDADWRLSPIEFDWPIFNPLNLLLDEGMCARDHEAGTTTTIFSGGGVFTSSMVGTYVKLAEEPSSEYVEWGVDKDFNSITKTTWANGKLAHWNGNVYEVIDSAGSKSGNSPPIHVSGARYDSKWNWKYRHSGAGYAMITAYHSEYEVTAKIIKEFPYSVGAGPNDRGSATSAAGNRATITALDKSNPIEITVTPAQDWYEGDLLWPYGAGEGIGESGPFEGTESTGEYLFDKRQWRISKRVSSTKFEIDVDGSGWGIIELDDNSFIYKLTEKFAIGAFNEQYGYPKAVGFYEDRLWWCGTSAYPQTLWASQTGDYENHRQNDLDFSALIFTLNTDDVNGIEWIQSDEGTMTIGTRSAEHLLGPSDVTLSISPGNVRVTRNSAHGSKGGVAPIRADHVLLFVQRSGRKIRELVFDDSTKKLLGIDMTKLSDAILLNGVRQTAYQRELDRILWVCLNNGELLGMTYERLEDVVAWHRHPLGGTDAKVESVAVIPHPDEDQDQLWISMSRTVGGVTTRNIEVLEKNWIATDDIEDAFFVDGGTTYSGGFATLLHGAGDRLKGETVQIYADGEYTEDVTVGSSGDVTISTSATKVQIGLKYDAIIQTMRLDPPIGIGQSHQGKIFRITKAMLRMYQAGRGLFFGPNDADSQMEELGLSATALFDGDSDELPWNEGYERDGHFTIKHNKPTPFTLIAIMGQVFPQDGG